MIDDYTPIDCDLHDYVEIACLHGYRLLIELTDGRSFKARAVTMRADSGEEFLVLDESEAQSEVRLDRLKAITPLGERAMFGRVVLVEYLASPAPVGEVLSAVKRRGAISQSSK